jgi:flavin-dependent dehydrogenase
VVIADRKATLTGPVHTTGIFVRKTWEDFPLPEEQLGPGIREVVLYSPSRKAMSLTADRDEFRIGRMSWLYLYLLEQCTRAGARWMPATKLIACDPGGLVVEHNGKQERITARYVVGADGARSLVAEQLGLDRNTEMLTGIEEIVPPIDDRPVMHCFIDPVLAPGYIAWIANDGHEAHIGTAGYRDRFDPARALAAFKASLPFPVGRPIERRGGLIPVNGILRRIGNERGLLVGDAAGAVSPLTAGGLDAALRLSSFAADVITSYLDTGDASVVRHYSGDRFRARFVTRRWMRHAVHALATPALTELACALMRTPPLRALARHVFFSRGGSFPEVPQLLPARG